MLAQSEQRVSEPKSWSWKANGLLAWPIELLGAAHGRKCPASRLYAQTLLVHQPEFVAIFQRLLIPCPRPFIDNL